MIKDEDYNNMLSKYVSEQAKDFENKAIKALKQINKLKNELEVLKKELFSIKVIISMYLCFKCESFKIKLDDLNKNKIKHEELINLSNSTIETYEKTLELLIKLAVDKRVNANWLNKDD